jgi:hypothetical protein
MKACALALMVICLGLGILIGCGDDDGAGPDPVTGVEITLDKVAVEIGHSTGITATVTGGDNKSVTWFVNDIENGDSEFGTITQSSAVTYTAPDALPSPRTVVIKAVSVADTSKAATGRLAVQFTKLFVDSATGDDDTATGCINVPYRTITEARKQATSGMTILVRPGTYSETTGEEFTIYLTEGVSLVGEDWERCIILRETAETNYYAGVYLSGDNATVRKLTLRDQKPEGTRWDTPVYIWGANCLVDSVRIFENGHSSCIDIYGATNATVQNCVIDVRGDIPTTKITRRGINLYNDDQGTIIRGCTFSGCSVAIRGSGISDALVENCIMEHCNYGSDLCCDNHETSNPVFDFGGGARGSTGGNVFRYYEECGLRNQGNATIYAKYNTWHNDPPVEGDDYCVTGGGSIVVD